MSWRSIVITNPCYLSLKDKAILMEKGEEQARVPLEDVAVVVIDHYQVTLTSQLLTAFAAYKILLLAVDECHLPCGIYIPFNPHHRALKIAKAQQAWKKPFKKQMQQQLIRQKIANQARHLESAGLRESSLLWELSKNVRSGDPGNLEAYAAQRYFPACFGLGFNRKQDCFFNSALNYGYAVLRAAIARSLVCHGFQPLFGLFHHNELNPFNLADDVIEPFRPLMDRYLLACARTAEEKLLPCHKAMLVNFLHQDVNTTKGETMTVLAAIEQVCISLQRLTLQKEGKLLLPE